MNYTIEEVKQFVEEEDVKFIRLAFCDVFGKIRNISILPWELDRAFKEGIAIDAWSITGFEISNCSDLFIHPDPSTLVILPWRPEHGRVVRMFCEITWPDGSDFQCDTRSFLKKAVEKAKEEGYTFNFGTEQEFYLFKNDIDDNVTKEPIDNAGYMDIAPDDKGENIRREICITLEQMGIMPERSHHEEGPGQNEIDFRYCEALKSADDSIGFRDVVNVIANRNGATADFSSKPLPEHPGNGMHINFSIKSGREEIPLDSAIAGILDKIKDITLFLNPTENSYKRLNLQKSPGYISWSKQNRSTLIRIPAAKGIYKRAELRSPDTKANPYLAYGLIIYAALYGLKNNLSLPKETVTNLYNESIDKLEEYSKLPESLEQARKIAIESGFLREHLPAEILNAYL